METLLHLIRNHTGDEYSAMVFIAFAATSIFVFSLGVSLMVLGIANPLRRRLRALAVKDAGVDPSRAESIATALQPLSAYLMPRKEWQRTEVSRQLVHAGYRSPNAVQIYYASKLMLIVLLPVIVLLAWLLWMPHITTGLVMLYVGVAAYLGFILPGAALDRIVLNRKKKLRVAFPDALDLMVVCVESGLGLAAAIQRVSDELAVSHPELAGELGLVNVEMRAGVERGQALKNLADRTGLDDVRGLVGLLVQTMRFGTSVADALRVYSEEFRDRRTQAAEEQAAKVGTKMIFPLVFCMFPAFFLVAVGPAVLRLMEVFGQLGGRLIN
jgi:tight adherence protein C